MIGVRGGVLRERGKREGEEGEEEDEAFHCGRGRGQGQWLVVSG